MSENAPAYTVAVHGSAKSELKKLHEETEDELLRLVVEAAKLRNPLDHPRCKPLEGYDGFMRIRIEGYRAICSLAKPNLLLLKVEKRRHAYHDYKMDAAIERARDYGGGV